MHNKLVRYLLLTLLVVGSSFLLTYTLWIFAYFRTPALPISVIIRPLFAPPVIGLILALYIVQRLWRKRRVQTTVFCFFCINLLTTGQLLDWFSGHRPPINVPPSVEMRMIDQSNWSINAVKSLQTDLETDGDLAYEILGWADAKTVVYKRWFGKGYDPHTNSSNPPEAYHLDTEQQTPFSGNLSTLSRKTCQYEDCIQPLLLISSSSGRERRPVYPSSFWDVILSPDGKWAAFLVDYLYGAYDLVVVSIKGDRQSEEARY